MDEFNGQNAVNLPPQPGEALPEGEFIPSLGIDDELLRMDGTLDLEQFQVVRREFFAHLQEPSVTFNNCKFYVNAACLRKFPTADFVQVLVNQETKILALRPCHEGDRDSFMWCSMSKGKRVPRQTTGKLFSAKMFSLMNWNPDYRYKMLGKVVYAKGEYLIVFDLTATEVYQKTFREGESPKYHGPPCFLLSGRSNLACLSKSTSNRFKSISLMATPFLQSRIRQKVIRKLNLRPRLVNSL